MGASLYDPLQRMELSADRELLRGLYQSPALQGDLTNWLFRINVDGLTVLKIFNEEL